MPFMRPRGERTVNQIAPHFVRPLNDKRAVVGERVVLECQLEGHPDPVVKWLKDGHDISLCPDYKIEQEGNRHKLTIATVQGADSGRFTAQALNPAGNGQSICILIVAPAPTPVPGAKSVIDSPAPPQTPVGPSAPIFLKELRHQPLKPGALLVLEARVAGTPNPTVEWLKNGKPLHNYRARIEQDAASGICHLTIPQMFPDDVGEYICKASNVHGEAATSAQLLPREAYERWFADEQTRLTRDRKAAMTGGRPPSRGNQQGMTSQGAPAFLGRNNLSDLDSSWGISESETEPELAALDSRGHGFKPVIRQPLHGLRLTEGTDAILQANIVGTPKPQVAWLKNGRPLQLTGPRMQMSYKGAMALLKISLVNVDDAGEYVVIAENKHGKAECAASVEVFPLTSPVQQRQHLQQEEQRARAAAERQRQLEYEYAALSRERQRLEEDQERQRILIERERSERALLERERVAQERVQWEQEARERAHQERLYLEQQREKELRTARERESVQKREQQQFLLQQQQQQEQQHRDLLEKARIAREQEEVRRRQHQQSQPYHLQYTPPPPQQVQQQNLPWRRSGEDLHHYQQPLSGQQQSPQQVHHIHIDHRQGPPSHISYTSDRTPENTFVQQNYYRSPHQTDYNVDREEVGRPYFYRTQHELASTYDNNHPNYHEMFRKAQQQTQANAVAANGKPAPAAPPKTVANGPAAGAGGRKPPQFIVQPQSVTAKVGDQVVFTAKATGDPIPALSFMKADGKPLPQGRFRSEVFADGSARCTIDKVDAGDADTYVCIAKNPAGSFQSRFTLAIMQAQAQSAPTFVTRFQSVSLYEGDSVKLYAKANSTDVTFVWYCDDAKVSNGPNYKIESKGSETSLYISDVTMQQGGWYRCDATNQHGTTQLKGRVVVQSRAKLGTNQREQITLRKVDRRNAARSPMKQFDTSASKSAPSFSGQLQTLQLIEGQTARFELKFSPQDDPNLKIAWLKDGKAILASSRVITAADFGMAVLEISPVTVADQGEYTVVAVNPLGEQRSSTVLNVIGHGKGPALPQQANQMGSVYAAAATAPRGGSSIDLPNFMTELRSQELFEGSNVHLEAKLTPLNDPSLRVEWLLNGKPLPAGGKVQQQFMNGFATLDITDLTKAESGTITARATNNVGVSENNAVLVVHPRHNLQQTGAQPLDVEDVREIQFANATGDEAPRFVRQLQDSFCTDELGRSYFEAQITPVNDPSLKVTWLKDGHPLPNANRITTFHNFGRVSLTFHPTYPEDQGTYTCVVHSVHGTAQSQAKLTTTQTPSLQTDTRHEGSLQIIGYLDGHQVHIGPQAVDRPEEFHSQEAPRFVRPLAQKMEAKENEAVHFEARLQPASDVKMTVEWYHNGAPLAAAHRFRPMFDFGYVALDLLYAYPEDSGVYELVARNEIGEAHSQLELVVTGDKVQYLDPHHPESLSRIQELEQNRMMGLPEIEDRGCDSAPQFVGDLQDITMDEHQDIHLDMRVVPINDPTMKVEWFVNGAPLLTGSRVKALYELGFIALDIRGAISEDSGTYVCRVSNALGEASRECNITVNPSGTILSDTQHEESLDKINYLENLNKYGRVEVEETGPEGPPQFVVQLPADMGEIGEGESLHLECQVKPYNDNTLRVQWLKDGHPIPTGHRFRTFYDFGFVSLDILGVLAEDTGTYTCVAENALGSAQTDTKFFCQPKDAIIGHSQHPTSYARIQEMEAPKPLAPEVPESEKQAPAFLKQLGPALHVLEGDSVYLEAQVVPTDDNSMTYEWLLNGNPLMKSHRYAYSHDFGYVALNILYCFPEDSGEYTLVVRNAAGEARSAVQIECDMKDSLVTDSFHPASISRIAQLEAPQMRAEAAPDAEKTAPSIVKPLPPSMDIVHESQTLHLEAQVSPIDDNTLVVYWMKDGAPLAASNRYRILNDFGYASLDIDYIRAQDAGTYTLVVQNEKGQAETSTSFEVEQLKTILSDTAHPESLRRIQEIEALKPAQPSAAELPPEAPVFTQQLTGPTEILKEGQSVHMDCIVQPINDPNLKIEWFYNGQPLQFGSRIRMIHDFGYVGLEFLHVHPEDSGLYECRATNSAGQASTELEFECRPRRNLYLDTQHAESWAKIQEIENRQPERLPSPDLQFEPPQFTEQVQGTDGLLEGSAIRLECRLIPVNDPTLRVTWTRDGQPLPQASRFMPRRDVELCTLDILALYGEDSGQYECNAMSDFGEAMTSCTVNCIPTDSLLLDTQHEQSWQQIQDFENRPRPEPIVEEAEKVAPRFTIPLSSSMGDLQEGVPIHLECQVEPMNDNELTVQWYHNGAPISHGHRFRTTHDFGYVSLDILYAFAQDSGEWACVATNSLGEAQTVTSFNVAPRGTIFTDTLHPASYQRIQEIEAPKPVAPEIAPAEAEAPKFIQPMESLERIEFQPAHFETRVTPINDPKLRIQWYKDGAALPNSNRFKLTNDFGFVALDIGHTVAEDSGTYAVVATNEKGEDTTSTSLLVVANPSILGNTQHEQSWARIQALEAPKGPGEEVPEAAFESPKWVRPLNSAEDLVEGQPAHFEAQFAPFGDPRTTVHWFLNGRPLPASNRRILRNDFGLVTLDFAYTLAEDAGDYMVLVRNDSGEDTTVGKLSCQSRPGILGDVQHEQSWKRIQEIEAPREPLPEPAAPQYQKPSFTQPLQSVELDEGGTALLEARFIPINDPNLRISWFLNDSPLADSNWISMTQDFGCAALKIAPTHARHTGVYSCKATNAEGAAVTSAQITVHGEEGIMMDPLHPASLQKIQEMESIDKYARLEAPEREFTKPQWIQPFADVDNVGEGEIVELHGLVEPSGDPSMKIEWLFNGRPLINANRYRQEYEFGNVILTIVHTLPHDSGVYTCRAYNDNGEATTSATIKIDGYEKLLLDSQHPVSWQRIQELEAPRIIEEMEEVVQKEKPYFLTQLESITDVPEGTPIRLDATFMPSRDPDLKVEWLCNGHPIGASQLVKTRSELGWATLDILMVNPDHNGMYTLHISNSEGEAASSASVKVAGTDDVLRDTKHEESWKQIQILEAPREPEPEAPAPVYDHPAITSQLGDIECNEGERVHFEATIVPVNDPGLKVQWLRNGQPLAHGSKYSISQDFGICMLDIGYAFPEDQGVYQLKIWNDAGEAVSSATLKCHDKDALLLDTQHEESWRRIQEIEAPKPQLEEMEPAPKAAPKFLTPLTAPGELMEGQPAHFETTVEPIDDPNMEIIWHLNGQPIAASSRAKMIADFGWIIMDIGSVDGRDIGEWTCVARNAAGEAQVSTSLNVVTKDNIAYDSLQPQSLERIQQIEAPKPLPEEVPAPAAQCPQITAQLVISGGTEEGSSAHLEAQFTPINDPNIKVEWFRNDQPLFHSNRYKMVQDFGFAILEILSVLSHDAGEYTLRVSNEAGEASTSASIDVETKSGLLLHPQNEAKARAVEQLEDFLHRKPEEVVEEFKENMPVFIEPLSAPVECAELDRAHFTARYEPINDNQLQVQWFLNGRPLISGSRVKTISDFGFCVLQISPVYPEDSGEYTCKAINRVGEAVTSTKLSCTPKEGIISQSQLPERMSGAGRRIAEIEAPRPARPEAPDMDHGPPRFTTQIQSPPELLEGEIAHLEAQIEPVNDPRLKVEWFKDGNPMRNSARMKMTSDFGFVVLDLCPAEPQDTGKWTCKISNEKGSAESDCEIKVVGQSGVSYEWMSPQQRKERITELEDWIHRPKEDLSLPAQEFDAPRFTQDLADLGQLNEAEATAFVCVLEPIGDPTLRVEWQHNGHAIPYSNRIMQTNEFGVATLLIKHLIAADTGEYRCIATNSKGKAETIGQIQVESIVQQDTPQIVQPLVDSIDGTAEGDSIHLETRITPINDPQLKVQWFKNGAPLPEASRFRPSFEFGFVSLDILYAYPEDNGDYELVASNGKGEVRTKTRITVLPGKRLEFGAQAHGSAQDNLESHFRQHTTAQLALKPEDVYDESQQRAPQFLTPLVNMGVEEGDFCRFETQVAPVNDPYMKLEWYKDKKPVLIGHRFRSTLDFGFACLDLLYALPDDTGEYTCVATNRFGQTMTSAKLACSSGQHIITDRQMPQGLKVSGVKKDQNMLYWSEQGEQGPRKKQAPEFTIKPRPLQVTENEVARFECALIGNPKPKVTWYINGNQALHGHRHKLHYDGIHYLTIQNCRISDAGEILAIARNTEGEVQAVASLDVFQNKDFRQTKLKPTQFVTGDELEARQVRWQKETLGTLGEAFEAAPKADAQRLMHIERARTPIEPMESEELMNKFMRPKDELFEQISSVEHGQKQFKGLELEPVSLKAGQVTRFEPEKEEMEKVNLRSRAEKKGETQPRDETPDWAKAGQKNLGDVEKRFKRGATPPREVNVPARDQVALKGAKPTRASEVNEGEHVRIQEEKAKLRGVQQGPEIPKEETVIHKDQVEFKQKFAPKTIKAEKVTLEEKSLKETNVNVKPVIPESTISNKPTPTKMGQTSKAPVSVSQQLKPVQAEIGKPARFFVAFDGALPIKVTWFRDGKEIKSTFENQIKTTNTGSTLDIGRLKQNHAGEYMVRLENVAGQVESSASLSVTQAVDKGKAPDFSARMADVRVQQGGPSLFSCTVTGEPVPTINWFKDGKPIPNDARFVVAFDGPKHTLSLEATHPQDGGIYECVAKNAAGEARCKARLNVNLVKTGKGAEEGPRLEAPRFSAQIQPVIANEGGSAAFTAKFTGSPEPTIRWYRNNEPIKKSSAYIVSQTSGEATLKISAARQEDVAEYKVEASNPAGKASSVANLVLTPKTGRIAGTTITRGGTSSTSGAPQFVSKLSDVTARQGHSVKFTAEIAGNPLPTVAWTHNGRPLQQGPTCKVSLTGNSAVVELARVGQPQAGDYVCTITNNGGTASCQAKLTLAR